MIRPSALEIRQPLVIGIDPAVMLESLTHSIGPVLALPDDTIVVPGHDRSPQSEKSGGQIRF